MKDKKYKIDYANCMKRKCDGCREIKNCFKEEVEQNTLKSRGDGEHGREQRRKGISRKTEKIQIS